MLLISHCRHNRVRHGLRPSTLAASSGDSITANSVSADTTANFKDNIYSEWALGDGGPGGPDDVTVKPDYDQTLAGNPTLEVDECIFFKSASLGGCFLCEGSTADTAEQLYCFPNLNGSDTTEHIVVADDANVSAAEAGHLDGVTSAIQTQLDASLLVDGSRALAGAWNMTDQALTNVNIDSGRITGIVDLAVSDGGTGASTFTDGGVLLGSGTPAFTAMAVLSDSEMIVGDGTTDPVAESGATLRTSIGVAIGSNVQAWDAELDTIAALTETNGAVMFVVAGAWTADATPAIDCTDCTGISASTHALDLVSGNGITGGQDNVMVGADGDVTLNIELKDNAENGVGTTSSVSGMEFESAELTLLQ